MLNKVLCFVNTSKFASVITTINAASLTEATNKSTPRRESRLLLPTSDRDGDRIYVYVSASSLCDCADRAEHAQHLGDAYLAAP